MESKFRGLLKSNIYTMFTLEQIKHAHSQVKSGADFPKYIQDMKNLWVTSYQVSVRDGTVIYSGVDNFQISTTTGIDPLIISPISDSEKFKSDLKNHQQGNTDYHTFCEDCAKSGIAQWIMNLSNMTCTYYDSLGNEILVEKIPS